MPFAFSYSVSHVEQDDFCTTLRFLESWMFLDICPYCASYVKTRATTSGFSIGLQTLCERGHLEPVL